jgi:drug/metabolite transporter (DMT)-like permease
MARAYSLDRASVAAPYEYLSLPIAVMWGFIIWQEIPTLTTLVGAFLTLFSGMYVLCRERRERPVVEQLEGKSADWMEKGSDEPYRG